MLNYQEEKYLIPDVGLDEEGKALDKAADIYNTEIFAPYCQLFGDFHRGVRVNGQNLSEKVLAIQHYQSSAIFKDPNSKLTRILEGFPLWNELCKNEQKAIKREVKGLTDRHHLFNILLKHAVWALLMRAIYPQKETIQSLLIVKRRKVYKEIEDFVKIWRQGSVGFYALTQLQEQVFTLTKAEGTFSDICFHEGTQKLQAQSWQAIMLRDPGQNADPIYLGEVFSAVEAYAKGKSLRPRVAALGTNAANPKILSQLSAGVIEVNGDCINLENVRDKRLDAEYGGYGIIEKVLQAEIIGLLARIDLSHYPAKSRIVNFHHRAVALIDNDGKIPFDQNDTVKKLIEDISTAAKRVRRYGNFTRNETGKNRNAFFEAASQNKGYIGLMKHLREHAKEPGSAKESEPQPASGFWEKMISMLPSMPKPIAAVISFLSVFIRTTPDKADNTVCGSVVSTGSGWSSSLWSKPEPQSGEKAAMPVPEQLPSRPFLSAR